MKNFAIYSLVAMIMATTIFGAGMVTAVCALRSSPELLNILIGDGASTPGKSELQPWESALPVAPVVRASPDDLPVAGWTPGFSAAGPAPNKQGGPLPQHDASGEDVILMTSQLFARPTTRSSDSVGPVGEVPAPIAQVILSEVEGARNQAFLAAMAWRETRYNDRAIRAKYGDDGGEAHGPWQLHRYWANKTADHAEERGNYEDARLIREGISEDLVANLRGVRAMLRVQSEWRGGDSFETISRYYNDGAAGLKPGSAGERYAKALLEKMDELLPYFQAI